jgi:uncharacterized protein
LPYRIWIDALTPKQALFAEAMVRGAPRQFDLIITTRNYSELNRFLSQRQLHFITIGSHGGGKLEQKLVASVTRERDLVTFAATSAVGYSFSFLSPEAARVSFGLGIPHIACSDSPHAWAPSKLVVPLSRLLFTPFPILSNRWTQYGMKSTSISKYHALDPWAWLKDIPRRTSSKVQGKVLIRLEEWFASYFREGYGVSSVINKLLDGIHKLGDFEVTLVPRYNEQRVWAEKEFRGRAIVPSDAIDGVEAINQTDLLIGGGATMTQEAALLGVPNISYFPSAELDVFTHYYFPKKLSVEARNPSSLLKHTLLILKDLERAKEEFLQRANRVTSSFEDPVKYIFSRIPE